MMPLRCRASARHPEADTAPKSTVPSKLEASRRPAARLPHLGGAERPVTTQCAARLSRCARAEKARSSGEPAGSAFARNLARPPAKRVQDPRASVRMLDVVPQPPGRSLFGGPGTEAAPSGAGVPGRVNRRGVFAHRAGRKATRPESSSVAVPRFAAEQPVRPACERQ